MSDSRYWSKDFISLFIKEYKSHPCLWKIKSKEYTNKNLKNKAYESLVKMCKSMYPEANRDFVVKKIQSLRGGFRKELKKVEQSKSSGASIDNVHVPSLWYYKLLMFTKDQEIANSSISHKKDNNVKGKDSDPEDSPFSEEIVATRQKRIQKNTENTQIRNRVSSTWKKKERIQRDRKRSNSSTETREFFDLYKTTLESQGNRILITEFDAVGVNITKKLQRMCPTQAIFAESIINRVLTRGLLETLSEKTKVCDGSCSELLTFECSTDTISRPSSAFSHTSVETCQSSDNQIKRHAHCTDSCNSAS